jgi:predicted adenylyl cyclase CyaB
MPTNLELKIKIDNRSEVLERVKLIDANYIGELNQVDIYYKINNGLLKLRLENGSQTLIKYIRNETQGDRWSDYQLISLEKNDAKEYFKDILEIETIIEKQRLLYLFNNTRIHIDNVKDLGSFLELETLVVKGKKDAAQRFEEIIGLLSLNKEDEIRKSYRDLMLEKTGT